MASLFSVVGSAISSRYISKTLANGPSAEPRRSAIFFAIFPLFSGSVRANSSTWMPTPQPMPPHRRKASTTVPSTAGTRPRPVCWSAETTGVRMKVNNTAIASGTMIVLPTYKMAITKTRLIKTGRNDPDGGRLLGMFRRPSMAGRNPFALQHMLCRVPCAMGHDNGTPVPYRRRAASSLTRWHRFCSPPVPQMRKTQVFRRVTSTFDGLSNWRKQSIHETNEVKPMRVAKRRLAVRPAIKTGEIIVFQPPTLNWRDRVRAMKAAQAAEQRKSDGSALATLSDWLLEQPQS